MLVDNVHAFVVDGSALFVSDSGCRDTSINALAIMNEARIVMRVLIVECLANEMC